MTSGFLDTTGGLRLFHRVRPVDGARAWITVIHGFAEHSGRYIDLMERLAAEGYASLALDLRGHGQSEGRRAYVNRFDEYLDDVGVAVEQTNARAGDLPVYLLGHSMGGLITALYSARNPEGLAGLILSSPGLGIAVEIPAWKRVAGRVLSKVLPTFALPTDLDSALLSHDPASVAAYDQDPLIFKSATARWYTEFIAAQQNLRERASSMHLPLLLLVAGGDKIVDPKASLAFYEAYGTDDRTLHVYEGLYHEVFHEVERDRVIADLLTWLRTH